MLSSAREASPSRKGLMPLLLCGRLSIHDASRVTRPASPDAPWEFPVHRFAMHRTVVRRPSRLPEAAA
jgi:hypothetical protein